MNRREAIKAAIAAPLGLAGFAAMPARRTLDFASVSETPHLIGRVQVYLDDFPLSHCTAANAREGWAEVHVMRNGSPVVNKRGDELLRKTLRGVVVIEMIG